MLGIGGFFGDEILHCDDKENIQWKMYKGFFLIKILAMLKKKKSEVTIFKQWILANHQNKTRFYIFYIFLFDLSPNLACAPLVDDGQSKLLHNIEKKKHAQNTITMHSFQMR
jgi:hypothetical protein